MRTVPTANRKPSSEQYNQSKKPMIRSAKITIASPCHEDWNKMSAADKGRFCGSCQKTVHDFTKMTDRDILEKINSENLCGRFLTSQLNRNVIKPNEKSPIWTIAASGAFALLATHFSNAQQHQTIPTKTELTPGAIDHSLDRRSAMAQKERSFKGIVSDDTGTLPGAHIVLKRTGQEIFTDIDGQFSVNAFEGDVIEVSFVGLETVAVVVGSREDIEITMVEDRYIVMGAVVVTKRRSQVGKLFHKVGNLFRRDGNKKH